MSKHLVIPDVQAKGGINFDYLEKIGHYIVEKRPDVVVCIGDFADMPSLSSYDVGKKNFEGRRYVADIAASHAAMQAFLGPIVEYNERAKRNKEKQYKPELHLTLGNHENRINRAVNDSPQLDGVLSILDLGYENYGWKTYPFLDVVVIDGIAYSHYFTTGVMGRPAASARHLVQKKHMSCTMGHVQNWEMHREVRADGTPVLGLFSGSCYEHDEDYLGPQGNSYDRGIWIKNEVNSGHYHPMFVSLEYLKKKYG